MNPVKTAVHHQLSILLDEKIRELKADIASAQESSTADTKSSMGDKHETSREIIRQEIDFLSGKLEEAVNLKTDLGKIKPEETHDTVHLGSLVETGPATFFISVPFGKIEIQGKVIYAISSASPAGKAMMGKKGGEVILINQQPSTINKVS